VIKISIKGLAKYITSTEHSKRKILRDFKYPDEEGAAQAIYYREARDFIEAHHKNAHPPEWLNGRADKLSELAKTATGASVARLSNNARVLREYAAFWGTKKFEVLDELRLDLRYDDVRVSVVPDLHVREAGAEMVVKFDFATKEPDDRVPKIVAQAMFEALGRSGRQIPASRVLYVDLARKRTIKGARPGARMAGEIKAACENIAAIWDRI
jgi:hypothetical protein